MLKNRENTRKSEKNKEKTENLSILRFGTSVHNETTEKGISQDAGTYSNRAKPIFQDIRLRKRKERHYGKVYH